MRTTFAMILVVLGALLLAGGNYALQGIGLALAGLWVSGRGAAPGMSGGRAGDVLDTTIAVLGAVGVFCLFAQFAIERLTAGP